jgi:hypothetical protein
VTNVAVRSRLAGHVRSGGSGAIAMVRINDRTRAMVFRHVRYGWISPRPLSIGARKCEN